MKDESPVSFPNLSLSDPALAALRNISEPSLPPYDSPREFLERLIEQPTRSLFTGTFTALAARNCRTHLLTINEPPSQSAVLVDIAKFFPEEQSPRFFSGNSRGYTILLPHQRAVVKARYHAVDFANSVDPYATAFDLFSDLTYESDISDLIWRFSNLSGHSFVAPVFSQTVTLEGDSPLLAAVYTSYGRLPGNPLDKLLNSVSLGSVSEQWHIKRFVSDVRFTSFLRRLGLFNSDCKPGNIIVDKDGTSRYVDFEFVMTPQQFLQRTKHSDGKPWEGPGTVLFLAPERFASNHSDPYSADIFSLALVYALGATGKHPFGVNAFDDRCTVAYRIRKENITDVLGGLFYRRVPQDIANICIDALDKDPRNRPVLGDLVAIARSYDGL